MNKLELILDDRIQKFKSDYSELSRELYTDKGKLIHPGEFGSDRERICTKLISQFVSNKFSFSSGFIIDSSGSISTQCDLIIYDASNSKFLEDDKLQRFFPIESIVAVGEIKSKQSKIQFIDTINKLANIKKLSKNITKEGVIYKGDSQPKLNPDLIPQDTIITFVICEELTFDIETICNDINDFYDNIEPQYKHNVILSIKDGLLAYKFESLYPLGYPPIPLAKKKAKNYFVFDGNNNQAHIKHFISIMKINTQLKRMVDFNIGDYLTQKSYKFRVEQDSVEL